MHLFYDDLKPQQESCPVLSAAKDYERPILGLFSNISQMFGSIWADRFNKLYSHLSNKRGAWNKRGGGAKVGKLLNVELGINVEGGIFGKN